MDPCDGTVTSSTAVTWRGDGQSVAVMVGTEQRQLVMLDGGTLQKAALVVSNNAWTGCIAWQPSGRHLYAAFQSSDGRSAVGLIENNGLEHGAFDIRHKSRGRFHCWEENLSQVTCSQWNGVQMHSC